MKIIKGNTWNCQYHKNEGIYYLTESHPEDGIMGEHFFYTHHELEEFVNKYKIPVFLPENVNVSDITHEHEMFLGEMNLAVIEFDAKVRMYSTDIKGRAFKARYNMTLELIRYATEEQLGAMLKHMLKDLDKHIDKEKNEFK